jgi:hypothetical protein
MSSSFSPDGARMVTGGEDSTARVWDARTGSPLLELKGHKGQVSSASFSTDRARIVTGSLDRTAKVWDARTGAPLLELKGHTAPVWSASFSPDGMRIVTGGGDNTVTVWDARMGTPLLDLNGHTGEVWSASFSPDGTRILTGGADRTARVWNARTGRELEGEPIHTSWRDEFSSDGQRISHRTDDRVKSILRQPDEEELAYRRSLMQPNYRRYREGYEAARAGGDDFAARFYLDLLPPSELTPLAESILAPQFAQLLLREDVLAALKAKPAADPKIQAACLNLAETWSESASDCNKAAWPLVRDPGKPDEAYRRGLRLAEEACRLEPENTAFRSTLGVAQYRAGLMAEAVATLMRPNDPAADREPSDLAILALAQHRLGQSEKARTALGRLREAMKNLDVFTSGRKAFLDEAEAIEFDRVFPADPFAP